MTKEPDTELKAIINQVIEEADHHKQQLKHEKAKTRKDDPAFNGVLPARLLCSEILLCPLPSFQNLV